ncbi:hypothetical protein [Nonomuraea lactucae]|uniref:hypothetical protein n=1 Tax=Nonomuraea lactucae TaxID=2249762 RepID=UPI0013B38668|nr:hypothetical protein [Nonomuraea lactucae]
MGTYDDVTLPLQPPIRLPSEGDLAAAVRETPLAATLLTSVEAVDALPEVGPETLDSLRGGPVGPDAVEVLREGAAGEVLRVWGDVLRHVFGADQAVFLQLARLFLGRDPMGDLPGALFALGLVDTVAALPDEPSSPAEETDEAAAPETGDPGPGAEAVKPATGERYTLTPLGLWAARLLIGELTGQDIPVMGSFAPRSAVALLHGLRSYPEPARIEELTGWLAGRDRVKAAEEIGAALAEVSPLGRAIGVELLALDLGDDGRRVLDRLLGVRKLGAVVAARLGREEHQPSPEEIAWVFVDMAAALLEFGGETDEVIESMAMGMEPDQQASTIALLALGDHPWSEQVLRVIIDRHPDERVAAAARKALRRLHSLASTRG